MYIKVVANSVISRHLQVHMMKLLYNRNSSEIKS